MRKELRQKKIGCIEGEIDLAKLAEDIELTCNDLASQGYEIINIATINAAKEKITTTHLTYSAVDTEELIAKDTKYAELSSNVALNYTESVIITARKIQ